MKKTAVLVGILFSILFGATTLFVFYNEHANLHLAKWLDILVFPIQCLFLLMFGGNERYLGFFFVASFIYMFTLGFLFGYCLYLLYGKLRLKRVSRLSL
jgi:hypothetical protein